MLRFIREVRGLTRSELSNRSGLDHTYISRLESGKRPLTESARQKLVRGLGLEEAAFRSLLPIFEGFEASASNDKRDMLALADKLEVIGRTLRETAPQ